MNRSRILAATLTATVLLTAGAWAHEGDNKPKKKSAAAAELKSARAKLDAAKKKLASQGKYSCCVKPSCDTCARRNGSCKCAANVAAGKGACGECQGGWLAGRGAIPGVDPKSVKLLDSSHQAVAAKTPEADLPDALRDALAELTSAKKKLVAEKRFGCCIKGGCDECAFETSCPCGSDLAKGKGVCGTCVDGWNAGDGQFPNLPLSEIHLAPMSGHEGMQHGGMAGMEHGSNMTMSSGTSQQPAAAFSDNEATQAAPMPMLMGRTARVGGWDWMLSANLFVVGTAQSGARGGDAVYSANWVMPMFGRKVGRGYLTLRPMFSLEPATVRNGFYPELFQNGETYKGRPIVDGQHPHDFFMELAASYRLPINESTSVLFYGGPRGDPALGPTAFPHRVSASENPLAALGHHEQDSTHIAANVMTFGVTHRWITLEASGFHGREPDDKRWNLDRGAVNSYSSRITVSPNSRWSFQFSGANIEGREVDHPLDTTVRLTASAMHVLPTKTGHLATSFVWGRNIEHGAGVPLAALAHETSGTFDAYLAETTWKTNSNWVWGRFESVEKSRQLLTLDSNDDPLGFVQAYTAGYERELPRNWFSGARWLTAGIGGQVTLYRPPVELRKVYGDTPVGAQIFLRLRLANPVK